MTASPAVVIKCGDDPCILRCIDSIDAPAEVVAAGFFSPSLRRELGRRGVAVVESQRGNLGRTTNQGIAAARSEAVVIMDSDSWFAPGTLGEFGEALRHHDFVKARVLFVDDRAVPGSAVVARTRQELNDGLRRAYTPGLGLRRSVAARVGHQLFDDRMCFAEDAELDYRRTRSGVPLFHLTSGVVYHAPVAAWTDLRSAFRIGFGRAQQAQWTSREAEEDPRQLLDRLVRGVPLGLVRRWCRSVGLGGMVHNVLWFACYYAGYYRQRLRGA